MPKCVSKTPLTHSLTHSLTHLLSPSPLYFQPVHLSFCWFHLILAHLNSRLQQKSVNIKNNDRKFSSLFSCLKRFFHLLYILIIVSFCTVFLRISALINITSRPNLPPPLWHFSLAICTSSPHVNRFGKVSAGRELKY